MDDRRSQDTFSGRVALVTGGASGIGRALGEERLQLPDGVRIGIVGLPGFRRFDERAHGGGFNHGTGAPVSSDGSPGRIEGWGAAVADPPYLGVPGPRAGPVVGPSGSAVI